MAREIKFRGFSRNKNGKTTIIIDGKKVKGDWVYGDLVNSKISVFKPTNKFVVIIESSFMNGGFFAAARKYLAFKSTVGQFTGLHDKNGKEIYEGDVITFNDSRLTNIVEYREGQYMAKQSGTFGSYIGLGYCDWKKNVEIIGNIHEQS